MCDDDRVTHRIFTVLVDPGIKGSHVYVFDTFPLCLVYARVEGNGIGASPEESLSRLKGILYVNGR